METCPTQLNVLKEILQIFASSFGLRVNYNKSILLPINLSQDKLDQLSDLFGCQKGSFPFTYLGIPLGTCQPRIEDLLPLVQRVERRLICTSKFLSQARKLEMVNTVLTSTVMFHSCILKLHKGVIKKINRYRKHCLWHGSDINSNKPPKATWAMVCLPKREGGLGVINLSTHNDALRLKFLHKFFNRADIPWVHLVWENYYSNGSLPGQQKRCSFWWRDVVKLLDQFEGIAHVNIGDGFSVLFWQDLWNGNVFEHVYPELRSFAKGSWHFIQSIYCHQFT